MMRFAVSNDLQGQKQLTKSSYSKHTSLCRNQQTPSPRYAF